MINISEQKFLKNCYNTICDKVSNGNKILEKPFVNSQKYMIEFSEQFNLNIPIEEKFVLAQFPKNLLEKLDLIITWYYFKIQSKSITNLTTIH